MDYMFKSILGLTFGSHLGPLNLMAQNHIADVQNTAETYYPKP